MLENTILATVFVPTINRICNYVAIAAFVMKTDVHTNDPSAGSPTETLLRLLLPLSDKVYTT